MMKIIVAILKIISSLNSDHLQPYYLINKVQVHQSLKRRHLHQQIIKRIHHLRSIGIQLFYHQVSKQRHP